MEFSEQALRPPLEAKSLLLRATQGCTWNDCHFCYVSRGYPFRAASPEQMEQEILKLKPGFPSDTRVYLIGSNPFTLPVATLNAYADVVRKHFPLFSELSLQSHINDISRKTTEELRELRENGFSHLYIGVESGNDEALKLMNKGYNASDVVRQLHRLDDAGIAYTTFYVVGLGGKGAGQKSAAATAAMFNQVSPRRIGSSGMTIFPNTPLAAMVDRGEFVDAMEREKIEELLTFLESLTADTFYDGIHYMNSLNYRFHNRDAVAKKEVLDDIRDVLATYTDDDLELMANRSMIRSL